MLIQFYRDNNTARVFDSDDKMLFEMADVVRPAICSMLDFPYKPSDWTRTDWGFEINVNLKAKRTVRKAAKAKR